MPISATGNKADAGFSLLEMLIALTIVSMMAAATVSLWPKRGGFVALQAAAQEMAGDLRLARGRAISEDRTILVEIDRAERAYAFAPYRRVLPRDVEIANGAPEAITFKPDGTSAGGQVELQSDGRRAIVRVARLTGKVEVVQ